MEGTYHMMEDAIQIMELEERISKNGSARRYFVGDLNGCRIVVFRNENVVPDEGVEAVWSMFLSPGKTSRWQHTDKGRASAEAKMSKARQRNGENIKDITDGTGR
jgi:hypothetical protein